MKIGIRGVVALAAALAGPSIPTHAGLQLVKEDRVLLEVRSLTAPMVGADVQRLEVIQPDRSGTARLELAWPGAETRTFVNLRAEPQPPRPGAPSVVLLEAEIELPDGRKAHSRRELAFEGTFTALFEVFREGDRPLTLAIAAEHVQETVVSAPRSAGARVELTLEIQYLQGEAATPLEENTLNTFVGEPVSYSFRLGDPGRAASLQIKLTPMTLHGEVAEVEMEISGTLPGQDDLMVIGRKESWMMSRGTTSSLSVVTGEPPEGFRFRVTALF